MPRIAATLVPMILIIDNYDSFTWNLVQRFGELDPTLTIGDDLVIARNDAITPAQADALASGFGPSHLVISPGPCTPAESGVSRAMIEHFAGRIPILGVCLGHQCIGDLHSMRVAVHDTPMHGKTSPITHDHAGLFAGIDSPMVATRYHSLVVLAESIPPPPDRGLDGWVVSAWTDDTMPDGSTRRVVMGLRRVWADPTRQPLEGVQFHPESFMTDAGPALLANFLAMGDRPRSIRSPGQPV